MSAINGKVCVVNGTPVDKVFSNGKQVYGRNLLLDSKTRTRDPYWFSKNLGWTNDWGTYLGSNIRYVTDWWDNDRYIYKDLLDRGVINTTDDFTYSIYFRVVGEDPAGMSYADIYFYSTVTTKSNTLSMKLTSLKEGQWTRVVVNFKFIDAKYDPTDIYGQSMRVELSRAPKVAGARYEFAAPKLEKGSVVTPYSPAPEDVLNGYIAAPRNLTATVIDLSTEKLDWE